jgi:hypothetical protein
MSCRWDLSREETLCTSLHSLIVFNFLLFITYDSYSYDSYLIYSYFCDSYLTYFCFCDHRLVSQEQLEEALQEVLLQAQRQSQVQEPLQGQTQERMV